MQGRKKLKNMVKKVKQDFPRSNESFGKMKK